MELGPKHIAQPETDRDRRKYERMEVLWWAQMEIAANRYACCVSDLSPGGAKVRLAHSVQPKQRIRLVMPPYGEFEVEVAWVGDDRVGIQFARDEHDRVAKLIASPLNKAPR